MFVHSTVSSLCAVAAATLLLSWSTPALVEATTLSKARAKKLTRQATRAICPGTRRIPLKVTKEDFGDCDLTMRLFKKLPAKPRKGPQLSTVRIGCDDSVEKVYCVCEDNTSCDDDHYCSFSEMLGHSFCKAYQQEGQMCGGYTIPGEEMVCDPSLFQCLYPSQDSEPKIADLPGTCQLTCLSNKDCSDDNYCSLSETLGHSFCKAYQQEGQMCGGYTIPGKEMVCDPSFQCLYPSQDDYGPKIADLPGTCQLTCNSDEDCSADAEWCRTTSQDYDGPKQCTPFAAVGEKCGGYTFPQYQTRCNDSATCYENTPMLADDPGTCRTKCDDSSVCGNDETCNEGMCLPLCDEAGKCPLNSISAGSDTFWCRQIGATTGEGTACTPYTGIGKTCDEFLEPQFVNRCDPIHAQCVAPPVCVKDEPCIADLPSTCEWK